MKLRNMCWLLVATLLMAVGTPALAQTTYMGYVDFEEVSRQYKELRETMMTLETYFDAQQQDLNQKVSKLKNERDRLQENKDMFSEEQFEEKFQSLMVQYEGLRQLKDSKDRELEAKQTMVLEPLTNRLRQVVQDIGKEHKMAFIFKEANVAYADPQFNLTDKVIEKLNSMPPLNTAKEIMPKTGAQ